MVSYTVAFALALVRCVRISIRGLVCWSVVSNAFVKINEKWTFTNPLGFRQCWTRKKEGRGGRSDYEEGGTGRKEGRGE